MYLSKQQYDKLNYKYSNKNIYELNTIRNITLTSEQEELVKEIERKYDIK